MDKYKKEKVLVVDTEIVNEFASHTKGVEDCENSGGILPYNKEFFDKLIYRNKFIPRYLAEDDVSYKQLIPYCIFKHENKYLSYTRTKDGGEERLHGRRSMGIGGHINPVDQYNKFFDEDSYNAGLHREIHEELKLDGGFNISTLGFINDNSDNVGKVHLGVVHLIELDSPNVSANETAIGDLKFNTKEELLNIIDVFENWSQYVIQIIK